MDALERRTLLAGGFQMDFVFNAPSGTPAIRAAVTQAAARWESILTADIPDVEEGPWGDPVDDLRITVAARNVDGAGGVLAFAEPRFKREDSRLPITGMVTIDSSDSANPRLIDILTHELGHVLGIGSSWSSLVLDYGGPDPRFVGGAALAEYRSAAGDLALAALPVENTGNPGTRDVHWREATFYNELMTGFYNSSVIDPLSRISAAALIDLNWPGVSLEGADPYTLPGGNPAPTIGSLAADLPTTAPGTPFTLIANNVADVGRPLDGAGAGVASVRFYRETNGIAGLQATGNLTNPDTLLFTDTAAAWQTTIDTVGLTAGSYTYYAQAIDVLGWTGATASAVETIAAAPPAPAMPTLDAASDHGRFNDDGITNVARPIFHGTLAGAPAGTVVDVFADGIAIGTADLIDGNWTLVPGVALADGARAITAVARSAGISSAASAALNIVIDTVAPQATAIRFESLTRLGIAIDFSEDVSGSVDAGDVNVQKTGGGTVPVVLAGNSATTSFFALSPLILPAGDYTATLTPAGVQDLAGNAVAASVSVPFFFLPGDVDRSRRVDTADLGILATHYNQAGNALEGDLNYSGFVDFDDLVIYAQNVGASLSTLLPIVQPPAVKKSARVASGILK